MSKSVEITVDDQVAFAMMKGLAEIARGDVPDDRVAEFARETIKEAETIRREGEPLHGIETSGREHGEHISQPTGVVYTLTITDEGEANEWRSDRIQRPDQVAWLHKIVLNAAEYLAETAAGPSGMN